MVSEISKLLIEACRRGYEVRIRPLKGRFTIEGMAIRMRSEGGFKCERTITFNEFSHCIAPVESTLAMLTQYIQENNEESKERECELKPCPFCGGEAMFVGGEYIIPIYDKDGCQVDADFEYEPVYVKCKECGAISQDFCDEDDDKNYEDAAKAWDRRYKDV